MRVQHLLAAAEGVCLSELTLVLSEKFTNDDTTRVRTELRRHVRVGELQRLTLRAFDPPSVIELVGLAAAWKVLAKPAEAFVNAYVGTLAKKAAEARWNSAQQVRKDEEVKPLVDVVTTLLSAADRVGGEVRIGVGLKIPGDDYGVEIWMNSRDPSKVVACLASFLIRVDIISQRAEDALKRGHKPVGAFLVKITETGNVTISWMDLGGHPNPNGMDALSCLMSGRGG